MNNTPIAKIIERGFAYESKDNFYAQLVPVSGAYEVDKNCSLPKNSHKYLL